jgi:hypothetical protein
MMATTKTKMCLRTLSIAVGLVAILPIAYVTQYESFVLRRSDVMRGLEPLVAIPLAGLHPGSPISQQITVRSGAWWNRMTSNYGDPKFLIAAVNVPIGASGHGRRVYRADEVAINVRVLRAGSPVQLEPTTSAPYIYSSEPDSGGLLFAASAGEHLSLVVESTGAAQPVPGDLVVVPDWPRGEIPSALDAFGLLEAWRWLLVTGGAFGVVLIVYGVRGLRSVRMARNPT